MVFHKMFDEAGSIATTDDGSGAIKRFFANHFGGDGGSCSIGGVFGETE